jgi:glucose/arabinose dehydrogenase
VSRVQSIPRQLASLIAGVAAAAVLFGCGGGGDGDSSSTAAPPPSGSAAKAPESPGDGNGGVKLTKIGDFDEPLYVTQPPGESDDLFVVQRGGTVRVVHDGKVEAKPFLDIGSEVETGYEEQGLLSIAFSPDYRKSGLFYAYYTDHDGDNHVVEFQRSASDPLVADPGSERNLMTIEHSENDNHNGGLLLFGPDRKLYIGLGDGGSAGDPERHGQSLATPLGKILRIDPRAGGGKPYGIPTDNPFVGRPGARPEIFEYGLRNPWRFSFDSSNGALLIGDVGQDRFEEVDYLPRAAQSGANLGWSAFEGDARFNKDQTAPGAIKPIFTYGRDAGCSITGGYVVRDPALPSLYGRYLYGDFCAGTLRSFTPATGKASDDRPLGPTVEGLSSFGVDDAGHVYATSLQGPVYRIDPE